MIRSALIFISILLLGSFSFGQGHSFDSYFTTLQALEFDKAVILTKEFTDKEIEVIMYDLVQLHKSAGQDSSLIYLTKNPSITDKSLKHALELLRTAKAQIVFNKIDQNTVKLLDQAIQHTAIDQYISLKKYILLTKLDLLQSGVLQLNNDHLPTLKAYKEHSDSHIDSLYISLHSFIFETKNFPESKEQALQNISHASHQMDILFNPLSDSHKLKPLYYFEKGIYNEICDNYIAAKQYYDKVLETNNKTPIYRYVNYGAYLKLSKIASLLGEQEEAIRMIENTKKYSDHSNPIRSKYYYNLYSSDYYKLLDNYPIAYKNISQALILRDSLDITKNANLISEAIVVNDVLKKEKQILTEQSKTKQITITLTATLLLGSIIAFLVYRNTKRKQRIAEQDRELQIQKTETILKDKEIETINAMVSGQEKERLRLAGELHDNLGSTLATVRMQVENLERNLDKVDDPKALLQKTNALVNEAYTKVRSISHERNSGVMAKDGLLPAIQKLARTVSSNNNLQVDVQEFGLENRIPNQLEITIFRIIQELITNIIKHAQASEASISLTQHDKELNIMVEDNGKGFKVGKLKEKDGMGLGTIERRIEHLEGSMEVDSSIGHGTHISIDIPL